MLKKATKAEWLKAAAGLGLFLGAMAAIFGVFADKQSEIWRANAYYGGTGIFVVSLCSYAWISMQAPLTQEAQKIDAQMRNIGALGFMLLFMSLGPFLYAVGRLSKQAWLAGIFWLGMGGLLLGMAIVLTLRSDRLKKRLREQKQSTESTTISEP